MDPCQPCFSLQWLDPAELLHLNIYFIIYGNVLSSLFDNHKELEL